MHDFARRWVHTSIAAALVVFSVAGCSPAEEDSGGEGQAPFPAAAGIQQGLSLSALGRGGWTVCYEDDYATEGVPLETILAGCTGQYLMLACRSGTTGDLLALGAADESAIVTQADPATPEAHHVSAGVGWYFTDSFSWGFFPATEAVNRAPCDFDADGTQTLKDKRLCWHMSESALTPGYRCGASVNLSSTAWQRLILVHP